MKILFLGDIVGKPARQFLKEVLPQTKKDLQIDMVIANGENAAGGSSLTLKTARELFDAGIDIVTSGDHIYKKKDSCEVLISLSVIRPLNYGAAACGRGYIIRELCGHKIAVINLLGRIFMQPLDCPFKAVREVLEEIRNQTKIIIVDMHAEATSEKLAMGYFLAGKVSAVIGTHTHIPTADERILDNKTAYITDAGMTGSCDSVLGREKDKIIERFITYMPVPFNLSYADIRMQGVIVNVDPHTGYAVTIQRFEQRKEEI